MEINKIYNESCLDTLARMPDNFLDCVITSPPYYGLRDYGTPEQIGLESTPAEYVAKMVKVFSEIRRALKKDGTCWLNLGDSYAAHKDCKSIGQTLAKGTNSENAHVIAKGKSRTRDSRMLKANGFKNKDVMGMPWRVAFALQDEGWYLRQDIIWNKPNPMPESVTDRCTKSHEYIFLLTKSATYYFDHKAIQEKAKYEGSENSHIFGNRGGALDGLHSGNKWTPQHKNLEYNGQPPHSFHTNRANGNADNIYTVRNKRSVWTVNTKPYTEAHFATFPEQLIVPMVLAGCPENGIIYDPFIGAGTTALVSHKLGRQWVGSELNPEYVEIANKRLRPYLDQVSLF